MEKKQVAITTDKTLSPYAQKRPFHALLRSVGNPDFGQFKPVSDSMTVFADSLEALLEIATKYREFWNLGCGNWPTIFVTERGKRIGWISYNGKLVTPAMDEERKLLDCALAGERGRA